jgi:molybdopterin biosynthesis enzyme
LFDEDLLNPSRVGAVAAIGCPTSSLRASAVAVLSTGNEVIEPGRPLAAGQIYDVNRFTLSAVIAAHGGIAEPTYRRATRSTRWSPPSTRARARTS